MKIDFTEKEYRSLVDLLSLATFMLEGYGRGGNSHKTACFEVEQKIFSYAEDAGCRNLIERDPNTGSHLRKWSKDRSEKVAAFLDEYNDDCFWDELIIRMAERDFNSHISVESTDGQSLSAEDKRRRLDELERSYEAEFMANGLAGLVLRHQTGEGMN
ncbi:MAG: hypothetical protein CMI32_00425 [Opitutales bacterium]|nr:hypothetical protein [Opitutales bacterium]|tara:strand:- start:335 stop:808 length:474 start_codon:yes stop_codon:yes gene_type:complete